MIVETLIVGDQPGDDFTELNLAVDSLTDPRYVDGTVSVTIRVRRGTYSGDSCDLAGSGGWLLTCNIEAFDPTDKPVFDGTTSPVVPFIDAALGGYESGVPTTFKTSFTNIIFRNYSGLSTTIGQGFFIGGTGGAAASIDFIGCEFHNMTGGECLQRYSSDSDRQAIVDSCIFNDCQYGILRGSGNDILVKNCVFSNYQRGSEPSDAFFAKIHVTGGNTKVFNNSVAVALSSPGTQDIVTACSASNNAMIVNPDNGNIDGIYVEKYGGNVIFFAGPSSGREINTLGDVQDLGSNITDENPDFTNPGGNDLTISATSPAAQNGIELLDVTDDIAGAPRGRLSYLRDGSLQSEVVYDAGAYQVTAVIASDRLKSGMISPTARLMLHTRDAATGSYPTIARTGDPDFTGRYDSKYDDTNTIVFESNNPEVIYPMMLPSGTKFVKNDLLYPDYFDWDDRAIISNGNIRAGISDAHVSFTPGENISPFDESRIYLDNDSQFYMTGTASGTLPGFSQRLSSKTSIVIDTNPKQTTDFFFSTGTAPNASGLAEGVNSSLGYYNWGDNRWEIIGNLSTGSNIDILNNNADIRSQGLLACVPAGLANSVGETIADLQGGAKAILETVGLPQSTYGFPFASRYDATGSQMLDMSNYITAPFLLEKMTLEFSASFGPHIVSPLYHGPQVKTFILLSQKDLSGSSEPYTESILLDTLPGTTTARNIQHGFSKSIIAFGQVSLTYDGAPSEYNRDVNIVVGGGGVYRSPTTGSFKLELVPKTSQKNEFAGCHAFMNSDSRTIVGSPDREIIPLVGGRSGFDISDGRSFVAGVGGLTPTGSHTFSSIYEAGSATELTVQASSADSIARTSPAVILPSDKLVLCFSNTPSFYPAYVFDNPFNSGERYEKGLANANVVLSPGAGKLTLFGSLLQNNLPKEPETNQPLTSNAVHEDLHYDNPVYDQWDVEPYSALSGSYVDLVISGNMLPDGNRSVVASVAAGNAGTTGSLQRFVRLTDSVGKLYDSYPPNAATVLNASGKGLLTPGDGFNYIAVGAPVNYYTDITGPLSGVDTDWYLRAAYEVSSNRFTNQSLKGLRANVFDVNNFNAGTGEVTQPQTALIFGSASLYWGVFGLVSDDNFDTDTKASGIETIKFLFGFGDRAYNLPGYKKSQIPFLSAVGPASIRGYKYGLAGLFGSSLDVRYRRDRYGQFRDMLEGRKYPATLVRNSVEYPIDIAFVQRDSTSGGTVDPMQTHSQNLDLHASSSLPYYDGLAVERPDNPDESLSPVEIA